MNSDELLLYEEIKISATGRNIYDLVFFSNPILLVDLVFEGVETVHGL